MTFIEIGRGQAGQGGHICLVGHGGIGGPGDQGGPGGVKWSGWSGWVICIQKVIVFMDNVELTKFDGPMNLIDLWASKSH